MSSTKATATPSARAVFSYTDDVSGLVFEWHGGAYIEVGYVATERGDYERDYGHAVGDFVAQDCINVWDYETDTPVIARRLEAFAARCEAYAMEVR